MLPIMSQTTTSSLPERASAARRWRRRSSCSVRTISAIRARRRSAKSYARSRRASVGVSSPASASMRSEEHTSGTPVTNAHLVCRLLLEKKKPQQHTSENVDTTETKNNHQALQTDEQKQKQHDYNDH